MLLHSAPTVLLLSAFPHALTSTSHYPSIHTTQAFTLASLYTIPPHAAIFSHRLTSRRGCCGCRQPVISPSVVTPFLDVLSRTQHIAHTFALPQVAVRYPAEYRKIRSRAMASLVRFTANKSPAHSHIVPQPTPTPTPTPTCLWINGTVFLFDSTHLHVRPHQRMLPSFAHRNACRLSTRFARWR